MILRGSSRVTRVLKQAKQGGFKGVYKINVVGSTGAGKTEFLKCLLGDLFTPSTEATRRFSTENKVDSTHTWFRVGRETNQSKSSTTTISMNTVGILLVKTLFNSVEFHPVSKVDELILRNDIEEIYQVVFFVRVQNKRGTRRYGIRKYFYFSRLTIVKLENIFFALVRIYQDGFCFCNRFRKKTLSPFPSSTSRNLPKFRMKPMLQIMDCKYERDLPIPATVGPDRE